MKSSIIVEDQAQHGGWRSITEQHVFDDGHAVIVKSVADAGLDATANMLARVPLLEAQDASEQNIRAARALLKSVAIKEQAFLGGLSNLALSQQVGMTAGEIVAFRAAIS